MPLFEQDRATLNGVHDPQTPRNRLRPESRYPNPEVLRGDLTTDRDKTPKRSMISWSEWQDSNLRPLRPERGRLLLNH